MVKQNHKKLNDVLNDAVERLDKEHNKYSALLKKIGNARFVLIGEATHGTHEFYQARAEITQLLIKTKGFMAVAIEADWPDAYRIHRYLQGVENKKNWKQALGDFKRFPIWMWRNTTLSPFYRWLRTYNDKLPSSLKVGFYGLDLYSLHSSIQAVIDYLLKIDPAAAKRAHARYGCFDSVKNDPQTYGYLTSIGVKESCIKESIEQLIEMQHHAFEYVKHEGIGAEDDYFYAIQNARLVKNAENYYRAMYEGHHLSWNVRDKHMAETLNVLTDNLEKRFNKPAKIIVWAHNSHVGDARATEMGEKGEINLGQLIREQHDMDAYLIGFSTYQGFVTAASDWDNPAECKRVQPGIKGSYEELFHHLKYENFLLDLRCNELLEHYLHIPRLQRAIGVIYQPETERESHYFFTRLPYQFDSVIHFDETSAVKPLDLNSEWLMTELAAS